MRLSQSRSKEPAGCAKKSSETYQRVGVAQACARCATVVSFVSAWHRPNAARHTERCKCLGSAGAIGLVIWLAGGARCR